MRNENIPVCLSLGIIARNGENSIKTTLESLFQQSIFARLGASGGRCEILCLAYGCTDRTAGIAREIFDRMERQHADRKTFTTRSVEVAESAGSHAWNLFVHELSAPEARYLFVLDDDTVFYDADMIYNLAGTLERNPSASVSASRRHQNVLFKPRRPVRSRISPAASGAAGASDGCAGGQLYCLRASIARQIYPPRDPGVAENGFLKAAICTDFFLHAPDPARIVFVPEAAPVFQAPAAPRGGMPPKKEHAALAASAPRLEARGHVWPKNAASRRRAAGGRFFRRLFPGFFTVTFKRAWRLKKLRKAVHLSALPAGFVSRLPDGGSFGS